MYVIYFKSIFFKGYVCSPFHSKKIEGKKFSTKEEMLPYATKFRFNFIAKFFIKILEKKYIFETFSIEKI